jgi:hypothetical protein
MDTDEMLRNVTRFKAPRRRKTEKKLSDVLQGYMASVSSRYERFAPVAKLWNQLLPAELSKHCRVADISAGQLMVYVDSSAYVYELRLCKPELLKQLQEQCPRARIKEIKFAVGRLKTDRQ